MKYIALWCIVAFMVGVVGGVILSSSPTQEEIERSTKCKPWKVILSYKQFEASVIPCDSFIMTNQNFIRIYINGKEQIVSDYDRAKVEYVICKGE